MLQFVLIALTTQKTKLLLPVLVHVESWPSSGKVQRSCAALSSVNGTHTDVPFPDTAADGPGPLTFVARSELALEADGPATLLLFETRPVHPPLDAQQHCSPGQVASEMPQASAHHSDVTSGVMLRQSVVGRTDVNVWAACGGWIAKVAAPSNIHM